MFSSYFLSSNILETYVYYVCLKRMVWRHDNVLPLLIELSKESPATKILGVTHMKDAMVSSAPEKEVSLMNRAAVCCVKNQTKPSLFHSASFNKHMYLFPKELGQR